MQLVGAAEGLNGSAEHSAALSSIAYDGVSLKNCLFQEAIISLQAAIANAATLDEVAQLEDALRTGHMPSQLTEAVNGGVAAMDEA